MQTCLTEAFCNLFTLKMGSRIRATKVRGYFVPSGPLGFFRNFPLAASKYLISNIVGVKIIKKRPAMFCKRTFFQYSETHLSPQSFFIISSTFLQCSSDVIWVLPLAANLAVYISANCFRVKAQPWSPDPKPTVPVTGSI